MKKRIYLGTNVYDEALARIERLYNEFEEVVVSFSGGKDSTVVLNLAITVAKKLNRLPVKVVFLDQEAEWEATIDYVRKTMHRPEVEAMWYQMPLQIFNSTSHSKDEWLMCWEEGSDFMREKEPNSIHKNNYGTLRFKKLFEEIIKQDIKAKKACYIAGVRTEESPSRMNGLTNGLTYKDIAWATVMYRNDKKGIEKYTFYPIYDWSYTDVWKAINDNGWDYCRLYDYMYQYGVPTKNMRVSNVNHETATRSIHYMQEIEPETFQKLQERLEGVNTEKTLQSDGYTVTELPYMFTSWREYRDYLLEGLVTDEKHRKKLLAYENQIKKWDLKSKSFIESFDKEMIRAILKNDYHSTLMSNFYTKPEVSYYQMYKKGKNNGNERYNLFVQEELSGRTI